ncbi:uncharacterized protein LOC107270979 isoform X2 [Cephus cinctus]|uniref:Uncharacterized protein LOC107270979 isoform X2 n=1 Tax=Cephus cinctus TaxID=211228 RepID=A0AAJ7FPJ7_CEPCN|nr:uncharacterized protein LOC107270979 isoform X2 [Cephus cinctus]
MGDRQIESLYSGAPGKSRVVKTHIRISTTFSERWRTIFSCCFRGLTKRKASIQDYDPEECDYIVEKLVVKRVPIALFATPYDIYDRKRIKKRESEDGFPPVRMTDTKNIYRVIPDMKQPLYYAMNDTHDKPSTSIHFAKSTDTLHEDAIYNYDKNLETERQNEYLNRFTALHPDLKECDRPPKDPCPLNLQSRNKRSLAEDISEIASTRIGSPRTDTRGNYKIDTKAGAVYVTVSDTSRELSMLSVDEEFPTRDTPFSIRRNASNCSKIESVALLPCVSFSQKNSREHVNKFDLGNHSSDSAKSKSRSDISSDDKSQDYESPKGKENYVVAPVSVHYAPRQLESFSKSVESSNNLQICGTQAARWLRNRQ